MQVGMMVRIISCLILRTIAGRSPGVASTRNITTISLLTSRCDEGQIGKLPVQTNGTQCNVDIISLAGVGGDETAQGHGFGEVHLANEIIQN